MKFHQLQQMRADHLQLTHNITLYPYQEEISNRILSALLHNLNVTSEADIKDLELIELAIEISRQAGKTEAVVDTVEIIMTFISELYNMPIHIGIFAPQIEQARTDFERLKNNLRSVRPLVQDDENNTDVKERENAKTLVLPNGSSCWIAPVTTTSKPESKTFHLMIFEEAQDLDDKIVQQQIWPIGATTNAPRIYIGTAGTRLCYFKSLSNTKRSIKIYFEDIVKQRRELYERTGDVKHLLYEQAVRNEIKNAPEGIDSDEIQRPYFGKWLIGTGQFTTLEEIQGLEDSNRSNTNSDKVHECFAGIDTAKHPDSTVVTVLRWNNDLKKKEVISWLELRGENYKNQYEIIIDFLSRYNIVALAIDSTGQGQFMPDWIKEDTEWADENSGLFEIKFTAQSKDAMYRNLKVTIKDFLTSLPKLSTTNGRRFLDQMVNLQQEYRGQFLKVAHPDDDKAHDDFCFVAGTLITTYYGQKPIESLQIGDLVLTRQGYKPIVAKGSRLAEVITRYGITGTPDHPFITKKGIKGFEYIDESDIIYIWNEKQSSIEEKSIIDTQAQIDGNSKYITGDTIKVMSHLSRYIDRFISTIMATYQKARSFITKMKTHLIMNPLILSAKVEANINQSICQQTRRNSALESHWLSMLDQKLLSGMAQRQVESGIENMPTKAYSRTKQVVYNLKIKDCPEYFVNNVLVHNCDSWALAEWAYAKWTEESNAYIGVVDTKEKERKVSRDEDGKITDYWPGLDEEL